ncbi:hypothetical protein A3765_28400 [Oleiphilus sp. HI0130]|nr:hypothetical protein A3765_28710 [Oleiphilus sp. HI0130]KZZ72473.1 hypothetical protein A3765_28400 [Oleiphilus sp. HI0130]
MKKRKQRNHTKATNHLIIGTQFGWDCQDPLEPKSEITNTWLSHVNPVKKILIKKNQRALLNITETVKLKWNVDVEVEFCDPNGKTYYRGANLLIHGILRQADGYYQQALEEIFAEANMRHYVTCHMTAEIIGTDVINDKDREEAA